MGKVNLIGRQDTVQVPSAALVALWPLGAPALLFDPDKGRDVHAHVVHVERRKEHPCNPSTPINVAQEWCSGSQWIWGKETDEVGSTDEDALGGSRRGERWEAETAWENEVYDYKDPFPGCSSFLTRDQFVQSTESPNCMSQFTTANSVQGVGERSAADIAATLAIAMFEASDSDSVVASEGEWSASDTAAMHAEFSDGLPEAERARLVQEGRTGSTAPRNFAHRFRSLQIGDAPPAPAAKQLQAEWMTRSGRSVSEGDMDLVGGQAQNTDVYHCSFCDAFTGNYKDVLEHEHSCKRCADHVAETLQTDVAGARGVPGLQLEVQVARHTVGDVDEEHETKSCRPGFCLFVYLCVARDRLACCSTSIVTNHGRAFSLDVCSSNCACANPYCRYRFSGGGVCSPPRPVRRAFMC